MALPVLSAPFFQLKKTVCSSGKEYFLERPRAVCPLTSPPAKPKKTPCFPEEACFIVLTRFFISFFPPLKVEAKGSFTETNIFIGVPVFLAIFETELKKAFALALEPENETPFVITFKDSGFFAATKFTISQK